MNQKWWILVGILALTGVLVLTSNQHQTEKIEPSKLPSPVNLPQAKTPDNAWLIEPGKSVGPVTAQSTLAELQKTFGAANVHQEQIYGAEGETYPGVVIYPKEPNKRLEVIWKVQQKKGPQTPGTILIRPASSDTEKFESLWHTSNGVTLGTPVEKLEALNGAPFLLAGFDWDYGGVVLSWGDEGKLREAFQRKGIMVRLGPSENPPAKAMEAVEGDKSFPSNSPNMKAVKPFVQEITVILR
jgi:hypothetical protein